ncbi:CAP domain-containing protein [Oceanobacillus senegalensis]|uniref:CAP domain-containing protein n=1 Tax=Oceanobacillus senegalensis TaxID=1936063 RepID=UPI000A30BDA7|nr:CAP domain-containing protein [Oceanobacillus senegalensis]
MFKKIGIVTALSTALILGTGFQSAEASSNDIESNTSYKIYYSINGEKANISSGDINQYISDEKLNKLINQAMKQFQMEWNWNNQGSVEQPEEQAAPETEEKEQTEAPAEQPEKEQTEAPVEQPEKEQPKAEAPAKQQPAKEQTETTQKEQQPSALSQFEKEVVELTNQERAKYGLPALEIDTELSKVARDKSKDMAENNYFSHNSPVYGSPFDMMKSYGISYKTAGENIAKGQRTPAEVVNAWMNSDGHRANILNENFTHIGVGYVENGNIWTQQFIGK